MNSIDGSLNSYATPPLTNDLDAEGQERLNQANLEIYHHTFVKGGTPQELEGICYGSPQDMFTVCLATVAQLKNERKVALAALSDTVPAPQKPCFSQKTTQYPFAYSYKADLIEQSCLSPGQHGFIHIPNQNIFNWLISLGQFRLFHGDELFDYGVYTAAPFPGQAMHGLEFAHLSNHTKTHIVRARSECEQGSVKFTQMKTDILLSRETVPCVFLQCIFLPSYLVPEDQPMMSPVPELAHASTSPSIFSLVLPSTSLDLRSLAEQIEFRLPSISGLSSSSSSSSICTLPSTPSPSAAQPVANLDKRCDIAKNSTKEESSGSASCDSGDRTVLTPTLNSIPLDGPLTPTSGRSSGSENASYYPQVTASARSYRTKSKVTSSYNYHSREIRSMEY